MSNRGDVLAAYQSYLDAFMAGDEQAIRECVQWPFTFLGADREPTRRVSSSSHKCGAGAAELEKVQSILLTV